VRAPPWLAAALVFVYALWGFALQGLLAASGWLGAWTPDLGLVLLYSSSSRLGRGRPEVLALAIALARACLGADPPAALAAGYLGAALLGSLLRRGLEIDRSLPRAVLAGGCAALVGELWVVSRSLELGTSAPAMSVEGARLLPMALSTGVATLALAPLCLRLPGLARLRRRSP
jgi:hypothetical protein